LTANGEITLSWGGANDTTSTLTSPDNAADAEKVEFVGGNESAAELAALKPDATLALIDGQIRSPRNRAENRLAESQMLVNPDTGTAGLEYVINFKVASPETSLGLARLRDWQRTDNSPGIYEHGRIGLKNKLVPQWDLDPTAGRGYQIADLTVSPDYSNRRVVGTLALRISGDPSGLGA